MVVFELNLFLFDERELKVVGRKYKPRHDKNFSESIFPITVLGVVSAAGVNGPFIFMMHGTKVYPRLRGNNLVTRYGFSEGYCVIPKKSAYMDDETWSKVVKVVAPGIRK